MHIDTSLPGFAWCQLLHDEGRPGGRGQHVDHGHAAEAQLGALPLARLRLGGAEAAL